MEHLMYPLLPQSTQQTPVNTERQLFTVEEFVQLPEFGFLTKGALRHLIFNSRHRYSASGDIIAGNGLVEAGAIVKLNRRILISVPEFRAWTLSHREKVQMP